MVYDYPDPPEEKYVEPICPICGKSCETFYKTSNELEIIGCDFCVKAYDAWEEFSDDVF